MFFNLKPCSRALRGNKDRQAHDFSVSDKMTIAPTVSVDFVNGEECGFRIGIFLSPLT